MVGKLRGVCSERESGFLEWVRLTDAGEAGKGSLSVLRWVSFPLHLRRLGRRHGTEREALLNWRAAHERRLEAGDEPRGSTVGPQANNGPAQIWESTCLTDGKPVELRVVLAKGKPEESCMLWHSF